MRRRTSENYVDCSWWMDPKRHSRRNFFQHGYAGNFRCSKICEWTNEVGSRLGYWNKIRSCIFGTQSIIFLSPFTEHNINFSSSSNLTSVNHEDSTATFSDGQQLKYDFLHATPPQRPIKQLREDNQLTDQGRVDCVSVLLDIDRHYIDIDPLW